MPKFLPTSGCKWRDPKRLTSINIPVIDQKNVL